LQRRPHAEVALCAIFAEKLRNERHVLAAIRPLTPGLLFQEARRFANAGD
jgi:hypothetical protein